MNPLKYDGSNWQGNMAFNRFQNLDLWDFMPDGLTKSEVDIHVYEPVRLLRVDHFLWTIHDRC